MRTSTQDDLGVHPMSAKRPPMLTSRTIDHPEPALMS